MASHLTLPWLWKECPPHKPCRSIVHLDEASDVLNSCPQEWVMAMLGSNCRLIDNSFEWLDDEGLPHAVDGPAIMSANDHLIWCRNGFTHREDGPADDFLGVYEKWWLNGRPHRVGAPAFLEPGLEKWYHDGSAHRDDGPAVTVDWEYQEWYRNGYLHRDDGKPAIIRSNGLKEWFVKGEKVPPSSNKLVAALKIMLMYSECFIRSITKIDRYIRVEHKPYWE